MREVNSFIARAVLSKVVPSLKASTLPGDPTHMLQFNANIRTVKTFTWSSL